MTQKALRFALEALDNLMYWDNGKSEYDEARDAIIAIKEALAQPAVWVGLTDDELTDLFYNTNLGQQSAVAQAIALLKERNT